MKKLFLLLSLIIFIFNGQLLYAQITVSGIVRDAETNEIISSVNLFVVNTMNGSVSDIEGSFMITSSKVENFELLVSHVSYQTRIIKIDASKANSIEIFLTKRLVELNEVSITSSKDKQWKRNLKKFNKSFFGNTSNAGNCTISNPWVLNFSTDVKKGFVAQALAPLEIQNKALGYEIVFHLEYFSVKGEEISYGGKPFFKEMKSEDNTERLKWNINREKSFYGSERHFYISLLNDVLQKEGYDIYTAKLDNVNRSFEVGQKLRAKKVLKNKELFIKDFLKVDYKNERVSPKYQSQNSQTTEVNYKSLKADLNPTGTISSSGSSKNDYQESYLFLRKGGISIDNNGLLSEPQHAKVYGYWSWEGVAELLPFEYQPHKFKKVLEEVEQNIPRRNGFVMSNLKLALEDIKGGGPPKDGIPALDYPKFIKSKDATYLKEDDKVIGINHNGLQKAYPINILNYHEIVNDSIGGFNYVVTFCPLCGSGITFLSDVNGKNLTFGVSGLLFNSDVLLYDDQTESLWSQMEMQSVSGDLSGTPLEVFPTQMVTWKEWKSKYPNSKVLSRETGHQRNYDESPYASYEKTNQLMFGVSDISDKYQNKDKVIGIELNGKFKAYPFAELEKTGGEIVDLFQRKWIKISFNKEAKTAVIKTDEGELMPSITSFWFAWYAFHPETMVYTKKK